MKKILVLILISFLFSCSSEKIVPKFYTINFVDFTENEDDSLDYTPVQFETTPYRVNLKTIRVALPYEQTKIAVRTKSHELKYYYYHYWAELPSVAFTRNIEDEIRNSKLFQVINSQVYDAEANYEITGIVEQIERVDIEDNYSTHLKMKLFLFESITRKEILIHSFDRFTPLEDDSPMNVFAGKVSLILFEEMRNFLVKVSQKLGNQDK